MLFDDMNVAASFPTTPPSLLSLPHPLLSAPASSFPTLGLVQSLFLHTCEMESSKTLIIVRKNKNLNVKMFTSLFKKKTF